MTDVQSRTRGIRKHVEAIELRLRRIEIRVAWIGLAIAVALAITPTKRSLPTLFERVGERGGVAMRKIVNFGRDWCNRHRSSVCVK